MGLAVNLINRKFQRKTLVIGMKLMPGPHNAENIIAVITDLVNRYETLDKTKIHGDLIKIIVINILKNYCNHILISS